MRRTNDTAARGAILIEFALVALVLYILAAAALSIGQAIFYGQTAQQAARTCARELAVEPLPAFVGGTPGRSLTFDDVVYDPAGVLDPAIRERIRRRIFDPDLLVVDTEAQVPSGQSIADFFADKPLVNRVLRTVMFFDRVEGRQVFRFPGALVRSPTSPSGLTVIIPLVDRTSPTGEGESVRWVPVVEEVRPIGATPDQGPFAIRATPGDPTVEGVVAVRVNIPFQSASMSSFGTTGDWPPEPNLDRVHDADDGAVVELNPEARPGNLVASDRETGPYAGAYGLGRHYALVRPNGVRPFRRIASAQAVFRRELFAR